MVRRGANARPGPEGSQSARRGIPLLPLLLAAACAAPLPERFPPTPFRSEPDPRPPLDIRLSFHLHTAFSADSRGTVESLVSLARDLGIDALLIADHDRLDALPMEGAHGDPPVLVLVAQEIGTPDGHLIALGVREIIPEGLPVAEAIARTRAAGGIAVACHPRYPFFGWRGGDDVDAVEIYSLTTDLVDDFPLWTIGRFGLVAPFDSEVSVRLGLGDPTRGLRGWDRMLAARPVVGLGACDSHDNFGVPHRDRLRVVTTRVLADSFSVGGVLAAIRRGRVYVALEYLAPVRRFQFEIEGKVGRAEMGGALPGEFPLRAVVRVEPSGPSAHVTLLRDGEPIDARTGGEVSFPLPGAGVYRVEVRRDGELWIASNPIRVGR
ncbi:MAG TPA: PHP domain-containing protein [Planctomycetota bacterium]|nr:PHP domain-containing protein [Planctomycetota bacterium]